MIETLLLSLSLAALGGAGVALYVYREKIGVGWALVGASITGLLAGLSLLRLVNRKELNTWEGVEQVANAAVKQRDVQTEVLAKKIRDHYVKTNKLPKVPKEPANAPPTDNDSPSPHHVDVIDAFGSRVQDE